MNIDEAHTFKYLRTNFGENVVFEPDGNIPPDFLVNSFFAIEVRRLNQNFFDKEISEGLEQLSFPIFDVFKDVLKSFDSLYQGNTFWVFIDFERPLTVNMQRAKRDMKVALINFLTSGVLNFPYKLSVNPKIKFMIYSSPSISGRIFRPAGGSDGDAGGWVIPVYIENLRYCITEKSSKVNEYLSKYKEWWLFLVDHMGWGLDAKETKEMISSITDLGNFKKVLIISNTGEYLLASILK